MTSTRRAALAAVAVVASSIPTVLVAQTADTKTTKSTARPSIATPIPDSLEPTAEVKNVGKVQVKGSQSSAPKAPIDKEELKRQLMRQLGIPPGANVTIEIEDDGPQLEGEAEAAASASPKAGGNDESKSQPSATKVGEVVVKGNADKFSDPTKTVIGIDQLSDPSDRNLLDVLEKQSGIIVRDDGVSLNGLPPSYTQILYDGRQFPAGMSLSTLRPEQVDRIEISFSGFPNDQGIWA